MKLLIVLAVLFYVSIVGLVLSSHVWALSGGTAPVSSAVAGGYRINGSSAPGSAAAGQVLGAGAGGSPAFTATASPYSVNGVSAPGSAAAGLILGVDANSSPAWTSSPIGAYGTPAGAVASPAFFAPTAFAGLPTCTAGGVNAGARGFVNNGNCSILFGSAAVATATGQCVQPVFCGSRPTATTGGGGTVGWWVGKNNCATASPWDIGRAYTPYSAGGAIPGKGLVERWFD